MSDTREAAPLRLAESVTRRICHDFAGLLGNLGGMLEMLGEEPEAAGLALESAQALSARLRLVRGAWGGGVDPLDRDGVLELARGLPGGDRVRVVCEVIAPPLEDDSARLLLCVMLAAAGALPRGGRMTLGGRDGRVAAEIEGVQAAWPACLTEAGGPAEAANASPREVAGWMCRMVAESASWTLAIEGPRLTLTA